MKQTVEYWVVLVRTYKRWFVRHLALRKYDLPRKRWLRKLYGPGNYKIIKQSVEV